MIKTKMACIIMVESDGTTHVWRGDRAEEFFTWIQKKDTLIDEYPPPSFLLAPDGRPPE